MTGSASTPSWTSSLTDAGIAADFTTALTAANGSFGYTAALTLLDDVANRGAVTASEFNDLQTIAANLENGITTPNYVASIFTQLVGGSPANATWTGGATASVTLGNLQIGTTALQLNELIGKWFLGTDLPIATAEGSTANSTISPTYIAYNLPLFGPSGGPTVNDISQGDVGDCELLAATIEVTLNDPAAITSMFVSDGNGIYGVRFYVNGKVTWVTVNDQLPTYQGALVYNEGVGLWGDLLEKAYAELSATGNIGFPAVNSYSNISGDYAYIVFGNLVNATDTQYFSSLQSDWLGFKSLFISAIANKNDVILESFGNTYDQKGNAELIADHAFAVVGYDSASGDFILRNPWGVSGAGQNYDTQFEVSMADITSVSGNIVIDNSVHPNIVMGSLAQLTSLAANTTLPLTVASVQSVMAGNAIAVNQLFWTSDLAGLPVSQYMLQAVGGGTIQVNGATNLASAAQQAQGEIVVSAGDLAKVTFAAGSVTGATDLLVSANDGAGWSTPTDIPLAVTAAPLLVMPALNLIAAPGVSLQIAKLFTLGGASGGSLTYDIVAESGLGTINLNGASDLLSNVRGNHVEVSAVNLSSLTFTLPSTPGLAILDVTVSTGSASSDLAQIPIMVGSSVASALQSFNQGSVANQLGIADSAANVFANLDSLQTMVTAWDLLGITLTDSAVPNETLTETQYADDAGALAMISGNYALTIDSISIAQAQSMLSANNSHIAQLQISDDSADLLSNLASLQSIAAEGKLASLAVSDSATPNSVITSAQLLQTAPFVLQENASGRGANGIALDYPGIAPVGGNSVIGFQSATLSGGFNTVLLAEPRSDYAVQVNASGAVTIKDIGTGDATYGQTVTVSGANYLIFDGAASTTLAGLPVYDQIYFIESSADAQLAQFYAAATQFKSSIALSGLEYWENQLASGMSLTAIAQSFLNTSYFQTTYGNPGTTDAQHVAFVQALYQNILGMDLSAENGGVQYWATAMDDGMSAATALISFTNATAKTSAINAVAGTTAGSGIGWLVDPSVTGGYADPGLQESASTVLAQAGSSGFYNLSLVDPTTVTSGGVMVNGVTLAPNSITVGASAPAATLYLSAAFTQATIANNGSSVHDGPGSDLIAITGSGDVVTLGSATTDRLNLAQGSGSYIFNFTPGKGSVLAISGIASPTATSLLNGTTTQVQGSSLNFGGSSPIYINVGSIGGDSAAEVVTAANAAYKVADVTGEHLLFVGTDSGGNADFWSYRTDGNHQVDSGAITQIATIVGVPATSLSASDLA
jgi:hypothetical protein